MFLGMLYLTYNKLLSNITRSFPYHSFKILIGSLPKTHYGELRRIE